MGDYGILVVEDGKTYLLKRIPGFKNHYISEDGEIYMDVRGKKGFKRPLEDGNGYLRVSMNKKNYFVHRLVALTYIENDDRTNKTFIDHIDNNPKNNHVSNLEWVSPKENTIRAVKTGALKPRFTKVIQLDEKGNHIAVFNSVIEANALLHPKGNKKSNDIYKSIKDKIKANDFYWKLESDKTTWIPPKRMNTKPVNKIDIKTNKIIETYNSLIELSASLNLTNSTMCEHIKNKKIYDGYTYQYAPKIDTEKFDTSFLDDDSVWREITNHPAYYISVKGEIFSINSKRILKYCQNNAGYQSVKIGTKGYLIHRLVAIHFIPNPENKPQVDHIDSNPSNNHLTNLKWATPKEQMERVYSRNTHKNFAAVIHYDKDGNELARYKNTVTAAKATGQTHDTIRNQLCTPERYKCIQWKRAPKE